MNSKNRILSALLTLTMTACGVGWTPEQVYAIDETLLKAGKVVPLAKDKDDVVTTTEVQGDTKYVYEKHDVVDNIDSVVYLGLNDDIIWPGNLVKGNKAHDFVYEPISVPRGPVTLSVSLEGSTTGAALSRTVYDPKLSTIRQGMADLLKTAITADTHVPAKVDFKYAQMFNESQMSLFVGADVSYGAGSVKAKFNWDSTSRKNKIMAKYTQVYYSIDVDSPYAPSDFVAPNAGIPAVARAFPAGSNPLYVASVSYGMMALMFIETDFTEQEMKIALDAAYHGAAEAEVKVGYTARQVLESSSVQTLVYGGSTAGLQDLESGFAGFSRVIAASKSFSKESPGVPLAYKFRHLADNTLALITLTSQYTLVKPVKIRQQVRVTLRGCRCTNADDEGPDNTIEMDRFYFSVSAANKSGDVATLLGPETMLFAYEDPNWTTMHSGSFFEVNKSITYTFDTENFDFKQASLKLGTSGREWDDSVNGPEWGQAQMELLGTDFFNGGGEHVLMLHSADFTFRTEVKVELVE